MKAEKQLFSGWEQHQGYNMADFHDIFGLGQCSLDYIGKVATYPPPDVKCECSEMTIQGGGPVATALVALTRWGLSCCFTGVIGDDLFGDMIQESLDVEGIDTSRLLVRKAAESQFAFITAEPEKQGRRTIFWRRPTGDPPAPKEVDYESLRRARVFHTDGLFMEASLAAAEAARAANVPVVVDAGSLREGMLDLARLSDYFLASEHFATALVDNNGPVKACFRLSELGPRVVGVTLGPRGYVAMAEGKMIEKPAYAVNAVDTTGCGDVFHAGFIYGLLQGWQADRCLDFGAWAASRVALKLGGRAGIPPHNEIQRWSRGI
ncbi:MAG: sugar kinase [Deltaproteobacteria bacterium]|nr:MAG: sugar kinase [Deltaproteobacteria bacterium]